MQKIDVTDALLTDYAFRAFVRASTLEVIASYSGKQERYFKRGVYAVRDDYLSADFTQVEQWADRGKLTSQLKVAWDPHTLSSAIIRASQASDPTEGILYQVYKDLVPTRGSASVLDMLASYREGRRSLRNLIIGHVVQKMDRMNHHQKHANNLRP